MTITNNGKNSTCTKKAQDKALAASSSSSVTKQKKDKKWTWKKPKGKPKRPLSAYNLFFQEERKRISSGSGASYCGDDDSRVGRTSPKKNDFVSLAKTVAAKWKTLGEDERAPYVKLASVEKDRYQRDLAVWRAEEEAKKARAAIREHMLKGGNAPPPPMMVASSFGTPPVTPSHLHRQVTPDMGLHNPHNLPLCSSYADNYGAAPPSLSRHSSLTGNYEGMDGMTTTFYHHHPSSQTYNNTTTIPPPTAQVSRSSSLSATPPPPPTDEESSKEGLVSFLDNFNRAMLNKCAEAVSPSCHFVEDQSRAAEPAKKHLLAGNAISPTLTGERVPKRIHIGALDAECKKFMLDVFGK